MWNRRLVLFLVLVFCAVIKGAEDSEDSELEDFYKDEEHFKKQLKTYTAKEIENFETFKYNYDKSYKSEPHEKSAKLKFLSNLREIKNHNKRFAVGKESFSLGIWRFSDLSVADVNNNLNGFVKPVVPKSSPILTSDYSPPASVNWNATGYVTPAQQQGLCGSCWSFSAIGALEGLLYKETGKLLKLSEQNLIDCSRDTNDGCNGGDYVEAFKDVIIQGGVPLLVDNPYLRRDNETCKSMNLHLFGPITSFQTLDSGNETLLKIILAQQGPISVAIDASLRSFQSYQSGIYYDINCSKNINHAVLLVGYGTDLRTMRDYWILKNSYGEKWGERGFFRLTRNADNHCGVADYAAYPV